MSQYKENLRKSKLELQHTKTKAKTENSFFKRDDLVHSRPTIDNNNNNNTVHL